MPDISYDMEKIRMVKRQGIHCRITCLIGKHHSSVGLAWNFALEICNEICNANLQWNLQWKRNVYSQMVDGIGMSQKWVSFFFLTNSRCPELWYFHFINWGGINSSKNLIPTSYSFHFLEMLHSVWKPFMSLDSICTPRLCVSPTLILQIGIISPGL